MLKKPLPIGIENFKKLVEKPYYYVDKTLMIKEILDMGGAVNLFTRPRRFGKTLALSMLRTFFEDERDAQGEKADNTHYFEGMKIMQAGEAYAGYMGKYPVISLSLKSAKQPDYESAYSMLVRQIVAEYDRHSYVLKGNYLSEGEKQRYQEILNLREKKELYLDAVAFLSDCLKKYHGNNVVILLDEYDVPLENAFFREFYSQMIDFIRSLFESALKTNDSLEFAVITGCLRISRESIFTGLNNLEVHSVLNNDFARYFGFVPEEVKDMLAFYGIGDRMEEAGRWYDGYLFGETEVYNPWSIINYVKTAVSNTIAFPKPYWSNTSSNSIVRELIERADDGVKGELEGLIAGGTIEKPVHEDVTYEDVYRTQDNLWNFLFFTGYLKAVSQRFENNRIFVSMTIPNEEVKYIYENTIQEWFEQKVKRTDLTAFYRAVQEGDTAVFSDVVSGQLVETISFFDYAENYYHGFLTGLLKGCPGFITWSNRESGDGRPDILMKTPSVRGMAILMELKVVKDFEKMEEGCGRALRQIEEKNYETTLFKEGYRRFLKYGICFYRKECLVKRQTEE